MVDKAISEKSNLTFNLSDLIQLMSKYGYIYLCLCD